MRDGAIRALKTTDWRGPTKVFFSPDGRFVAYDLPVDDSRPERDVFVMAVDGSHETDAVANPGEDVVMGWSPDGAYLLFSSDRSGGGPCRIVIRSADSGDAREVSPRLHYIQWLRWAPLRSGYGPPPARVRSATQARA